MWIGFGLKVFLDFFFVTTVTTLLTITSVTTVTTFTIVTTVTNVTIVTSVTVKYQMLLWYSSKEYFSQKFLGLTNQKIDF